MVAPAAAEPLSPTQYAVRALPAARAVIPVVLIVAAATTVAWAAQAPGTPAQTTCVPTVISRVLEIYLLTGGASVFGRPLRRLAAPDPALPSRRMAARHSSLPAAGR